MATMEKVETGGRDCGTARLTAISSTHRSTAFFMVLSSWPVKRPDYSRVFNILFITVILSGAPRYLAITWLKGAESKDPDCASSLDRASRHSLENSLMQLGYVGFRRSFDSPSSRKRNSRSLRMTAGPSNLCKNYLSNP